MSIKAVFKNNKEALLNIYFTAGYPKLDSLPVILEALEASGTDMVEIGIPYSDPLSDGPTIQHSSSIAIQNGITTDLIFEQIENSTTQIPIILMGYFNSVLQYGVEKFCQRCQQNKISTLILPDLPIEIYNDQYRDLFTQHGLSMVFLVTPQTSDERIRYIDSLICPFIYIVSSTSTTGSKSGIKSSADYLQRIKNMNLDTPLMVGFNIGSHEDFVFANNYTSGGIIGSAFIRHIAESNDLKKDITTFISKILKPKQ